MQTKQELLAPEVGLLLEEIPETTLSSGPIPLPFLRGRVGREVVMRLLALALVLSLWTVPVAAQSAKAFLLHRPIADLNGLGASTACLSKGLYVLVVEAIDPTKKAVGAVVSDDAARGAVDFDSLRDAVLENLGILEVSANDAVGWTWTSIKRPDDGCITLSAQNATVRLYELKIARYKRGRL